MAEVDTDVSNPFFARLYHHVLRRGAEAERVIRCRRRLLEGLRGQIVEIGPGNGPNFPLYPSSVDKVSAVEPETYLRERAAAAARSADVAIDVVAGDAEHLPLPDGSVDAVVLALVLCSVPDQRAALLEARRVLRPGGEIRLFEHVVAEQPIARAAQQAAQATFWPRAFGGCHPARDTLAAVDEAGFETSGVKRFVLHPGGVQPPMPHILGAAPLARARA